MYNVNRATTFKSFILLCNNARQHRLKSYQFNLLPKGSKKDSKASGWGTALPYVFPQLLNFHQCAIFPFGFNLIANTCKMYTTY